MQGRRSPILIISSYLLARFSSEAGLAVALACDVMTVLGVGPITPAGGMAVGPVGSPITLLHTETAPVARLTHTLALLLVTQLQATLSNKRHLS